MRTADETRFSRNSGIGAAEVASGSSALQAHGSSFEYRGAVVHGNADGTLFQISMPGTELDGWKGICGVYIPCSLIDSHLDHPTVTAGPVVSEKSPKAGRALPLDRLYELVTGRSLSERNRSRTSQEAVKKSRDVSPQ